MTDPYRPSVGEPIPIDPEATRRRVVAVSIPGSDPLELVGPLEVLSAANYILREAGSRPELGYDVEVVSSARGTLYAWPGLKLVAEKTYRSVKGPVDTLMVQAVDPDERCLADKGLLQWLRRMAPKVRRMASICTGTYMLAEAGVLDGRRATTHWAWCENLGKRYPAVQIEPDPIYVRDGNVYTSAGATAGMDLTLAFVEEDFGRELALKVAQFMVVFLKRGGGQAQFSAQLSMQVADRDAIRDLQQWILGHLDADLSVEALAERVNMSPRNFARVFARETGMTPGRFVERWRLETARQRLEDSSLSVGQIARECGYGSDEAMRQAFVRNLKISPREYRSRFSASA